MDPIAASDGCDVRPSRRCRRRSSRECQAQVVWHHGLGFDGYRCNLDRDEVADFRGRRLAKRLLDAEPMPAAAVRLERGLKREAVETAIHGRQTPRGELCACLLRQIEKRPSDGGVGGSRSTEFRGESNPARGFVLIRFNVAVLSLAAHLRTPSRRRRRRKGTFYFMS